MASTRPGRQRINLQITLNSSLILPTLLPLTTLQQHHDAGDGDDNDAGDDDDDDADAGDDDAGDDDDDYDNVNDNKGDDVNEDDVCR